MAFFKNELVAQQLLTKRGNSWAKHGIIATSIEAKQVPCTILNMSFFNKLKDPENGVIHNSGMIAKRYDEEINGILISDNLRGMLLDEESDEYNLYSEEDRKEFIFKIFQLLVLGGTLCQYEDSLDPYLNVTKDIYKDLIRVQKRNTSDGLSVSTLILEVVVKDYQSQAFFPYQPYNKQNVGFLLIDGSAREITTILHQYGDCLISE
ncbi:hypothetical protein KM043_017029 [Ampulex compressa]|nr:hypothetical protein KM043_017029 [Ampulex compressa]